MTYFCEECGHIESWTATLFAEKGAPVCPNDDNDMELRKEDMISLVGLMPFDSIMDGDTMPCALWKSEENICEYGSQNQPDPSDTSGLCDTSGYYYGTEDTTEPKFCARHFYQIVVSGDGKSNYALVDVTRKCECGELESVDDDDDHRFCACGLRKCVPADCEEGMHVNQDECGHEFIDGKCKNCGEYEVR